MSKATSIAEWESQFGDEQYSRAFEAIVKGSPEKIQSPMIIGALVDELKTRGTFANEEHVTIVDIGSHDGSTLQNILSHSGKLGSVKVYGLDYKPDAVVAFERRFSDIRLPPHIKITSANTASGNAFSGKIANDLKIDNNGVNIAVVSHLMYGINPSDINTLVKNISCSLLSPNGIGILLHAKDSPNSFLSLRNKYGGRAERDITASAEKITNSPEAIALAAQENNATIRELEYRTRVYFDKMTDEEWELIKDPANFSGLRGNVVDNILRISFIPLRTPQNMPLDWAKLVDEVKQIVKKNETEKDRGYLEDVTSMQILMPTATKAQDGLKGKVEQAIQAVQEKLPGINVQAEREFSSKIGIV